MTTPQHDSSASTRGVTTPRGVGMDMDTDTNMKADVNTDMDMDTDMKMDMHMGTPRHQVLKNAVIPTPTGVVARPLSSVRGGYFDSFEFDLGAY